MSMGIPGVEAWMRLDGDAARSAAKNLQTLAADVAKTRRQLRRTLGQAGTAMSWKGKIVDRADTTSSPYADLFFRLADAAQQSGLALTGLATDLDEHAPRIRGLEAEYKSWHTRPALAPTGPGPHPDPDVVAAQSKRIVNECESHVERLKSADRRCSQQLASAADDVQGLSAPDVDPQWTKSLVPQDLWKVMTGHSEVTGALAKVDQQPVDGYSHGPAQRPDMTYDNDFPYDTKNAGPGDYAAKAKWLAMLAVGKALPELDDSTAMYAHYWDNTGTPMTFDYEEAVQEDPAIKANVDTEVARSAKAVNQMVTEGNTDFSFSGSPHPSTEYPETENWQKTVGAYNQWGSGDVIVKDGRVTMTVTVHADDRYNFNKGSADIATGAPDNANGRFSEVGWCRDFQTSGSVKRTISWKVGDPPPTSVAQGQEQRDRGGEDRADR